MWSTPGITFYRGFQGSQPFSFFIAKPSQAKVELDGLVGLQSCPRRRSDGACDVPAD